MPGPPAFAKRVKAATPGPKAKAGCSARELRLGKPRALTGYAWRCHAETVRPKRVRRSLSEAKA
jgi:hypothetical protein